MLRTIALIAALAAEAGCAHVSPGASVPWGQKRGGPGVGLSLVEEKRAPEKGGTRVSYRLVAEGADRTREYGLYVRGRDSKDLSELFRPDGHGGLVGHAGQALEDHSIGVTGYPKGLPLEVALISEDGTRAAFARVVPFPIEGRDGLCELRVELEGDKGLIFTVFGSGFDPLERAEFVSLSGTERVSGRLDAAADGTLRPAVILPETTTGHQVHVEVHGARCKPSVDFVWGPEALIPR